MFHHEPSSIPEAPRHPHQEIVDLLATAFLRLRRHATSAAKGESAVDLGFAGQQRVHANPSQPKGVR
jgi:hypothetical protein